MSIYVRVDFKDRRVQKALRKWKKSKDILGQVFRDLRPRLREDLVEAAEKETGPSGAWPRRAPTTEKQKTLHAPTVRSARGKTRRASGPARQVARGSTRLLGRLPDTVPVTTRGLSVGAKSSVKWAGIHNDGGVAGHGARIPKREFVFLSRDFLDDAVDAIEKRFISVWGAQ